ncbi:hypothetical protein PoMZ_03715 [Pyricularia oryzae]|uniref:Uncharacterized protein n=1 Tax=Pyricularia oryzae TaxID=318829 RepID=A0A4P7N7S7_PYROR|nr:hypothetical protein PoMZ_03715 [Pyricularia oryzae]
MPFVLAGKNTQISDPGFAACCWKQSFFCTLPPSWISGVPDPTSAMIVASRICSGDTGYSGAPVKGDCTTYYKSAGRGFWEWSIGAENRKKDIQYTHICKEATSDNIRSSADSYPATSEKEKGVLLVRVILVKQRPRQGTLGFIANRQRSGKGAEESGRLK